MNNGSAVMAIDELGIERVRELLRSVQVPESSRNIVAAGFVTDIEVKDNEVKVHFAPDTRNDTKIERMEEEIYGILGGDKQFEWVEIERHIPFANAGVLSEGGGRTPLQAEMLQDGIVPESDIIGGAMERADMAPDAGYTEDGVEPLGGRAAASTKAKSPSFSGKSTRMTLTLSQALPILLSMTGIFECGGRCIRPNSSTRPFRLCATIGWNMKARPGPTRWGGQRLLIWRTTWSEKPWSRYTEQSVIFAHSWTHFIAATF